jgi:hypothetical protein
LAGERRFDELPQTVREELGLEHAIGGRRR